MKLLTTTQIVDKDDPMLGFFHGWIEEFAKYFERIDVICLKEGQHELPEHVHVHSLGKEAGENRFKYTFRFYRYFWRYYMNQHVDFVFFHMGAIYNVLAAPFFLIRKLKHTKFYWWKTHGHINLLGRIALFFVDRVYTAVEESFPIVTKKRIVVGHAIDIEQFPFNKSTRERTLLFVGRISRSKRIEQVIETARQLKERGFAIPTKIIGPITDEQYFRELEKRVSAHQLHELITFVPGVPHHELQREYQRAMVLMNPSDNDGLDKVVLEAMLGGAIPITANLSFEKMLSPFGLFMEKNDIDGYSKRIIEIFEMDHEKRVSLGKELRMVVEEGHALSTLSKRIFHVG